MNGLAPSRVAVLAEQVEAAQATGRATVEVPVVDLVMLLAAAEIIEACRRSLADEFRMVWFGGTS